MDQVPPNIIRIPQWLILITLGVSIISNTFLGISSLNEIYRTSFGPSSRGIFLMPVNKNDTISNLGLLELIDKPNEFPFNTGVISYENGTIYITPRTKYSSNNIRLTSSFSLEDNHKPFYTIPVTPKENKNDAVNSFDDSTKRPSATPNSNIIEDSYTTISEPLPDFNNESTQQTTFYGTVEN
ncbi:hypothetical protein BDC45DRAFT_260320 [Circinella umbellata]|nr:hypothetical protein BDC45DRAFT_260320 [Circinella umbellata]